MPDNEPLRDTLVLEALGSWQALNERIKELTEAELYSALNTEMSHDRRGHIVTRIHARYMKLKAAREREELLAACKK